jgi:hypothetical protein
MSVRYWCDVIGCDTEIPAGTISVQHTCSWCGRHSCYPHIMVDVWGNSACDQCARHRMIAVRLASAKPGTEARLSTMTA